MTKRQHEKQLEMEQVLIIVNHEWWQEEMGKTMAEIESIEEMIIPTKKSQKRLEILQNQLSYLEKKANFENKNIKKFEKNVKKFNKIYDS